MTESILKSFEVWTAVQGIKSKGRVKSVDNISLEGITKLRELILELAIRGKLVPQDEKDEPARVMLKKIEKEKVNRVKEGKQKKESALPEIAADEIPYRLPTGWLWCRLADVGQVNPRNSFDDDNEVSFVPMNLISSEFRVTPQFEKRLWKEVKSSFTHLAENDVAVAKITPCFENSKSGIFRGLINGIGAGTTELHIFRGDVNYILPDYVYLYFKSPNFLNAGESRMTGSAGQKRVPSDFIKNCVFPFPPLAEQQRIVAKVDELMALCDELETVQTTNLKTHQALVKTLLQTLTSAANATELHKAWLRLSPHFDTLFCTEDSIEQLKQTILQLAIMGRLVKQNPTDEPATALLKRIKGEKEKLVKAGKLKKEKELPAIGEDEKPFELPEGWVWCRLNNAIDVRDGTHDSPKDAIGSNTFPLVTSKDFVDGKINFDTARQISEKDHFEISKRSKVDVLDILFSMIGGNLGNQVIVLDERPFSIKNLALFKFYDRDYTSPLFFKIVTEYIALTLQRKATGGAQPFVSLGYLRQVVIALPPINEQHRIVAKVQQLQQQLSQLQTRLQQSNTYAQQLLQTVLQGAFEGKENVYKMEENEILNMVAEGEV